MKLRAKIYPSEVIEEVFILGDKIRVGDIVKVKEILFMNMRDIRLLNVMQQLVVNLD